MEIRCADCGCLPSESEASVYPTNIPIADAKNVVAGEFVIQLPERVQNNTVVNQKKRNGLGEI